MTTLRDVVLHAHSLWPLSGSEEWDTPGLVTGSLDQELNRILLAVDAVSLTVNEAIETRSDLLLTHHPLLLRGITTVTEEAYKGNLIAQLIRGNVALLAAHTNADVVENGVSAVIARKLGLTKTAPLTPGTIPGTGIGRVGDLPDARTLGDLARSLADLLPATAGGVKVSGEYTQQVQRVSLCGGAGDSLLTTKGVLSSDVYITSDLRHHPAQEFREQALLSGGPALIDIAHWAAEWLWLETAAEQLRTAFPNLDVVVSELRTDPWDFIVVQ